MSWSTVPGIYRKFETDSTICGKLWVLCSVSLRYVGQVRFVSLS